MQESTLLALASTFNPDAIGTGPSGCPALGFVLEVEVIGSLVLGSGFALAVGLALLAVSDVFELTLAPTLALNCGATTALGCGSALLLTVGAFGPTLLSPLELLEALLLKGRESPWVDVFSLAQLQSSNT
jgi:hypothetical protein